MERWEYCVVKGTAVRKLAERRPGRGLFEGPRFEWTWTVNERGWPSEEALLNAWGEEGWELVSCGHPGSVSDSANEVAYRAVFKRRLV